MRTNQTKTPAAISTIGIDLGRTTFHLIGLDKRGAIVSQQKVPRGQFERRPATVLRCLIGMEVLLGCPLHRPAARSAGLSDISTCETDLAA